MIGIAIWMILIDYWLFSSRSQLWKHSHDHTRTFSAQVFFPDRGIYKSLGSIYTQDTYYYSGNGEILILDKRGTGNFGFREVSSLPGSWLLYPCFVCKSIYVCVCVCVCVGETGMYLPPPLSEEIDYSTLDWGFQELGSLPGRKRPAGLASLPPLTHTPSHTHTHTHARTNTITHTRTQLSLKNHKQNRENCF